MKKKPKGPDEPPAKMDPITESIVSRAAREPKGKRRDVLEGETSTSVIQSTRITTTRQDAKRKEFNLFASSSRRVGSLKLLMIQDLTIAIVVLISSVFLVFFASKLSWHYQKYIREDVPRRRVPIKNYSFIDICPEPLEANPRDLLDKIFSIPFVNDYRACVNYYEQVCRTSCMFIPPLTSARDFYFNTALTRYYKLKSRSSTDAKKLTDQNADYCLMFTPGCKSDLSSDFADNGRECPGFKTRCSTQSIADKVTDSTVPYIISRKDPLSLITSGTVQAESSYPYSILNSSETNMIFISFFYDIIKPKVVHDDKSNLCVRKLENIVRHKFSPAGKDRLVWLLRHLNSKIKFFGVRVREKLMAFEGVCYSFCTNEDLISMPRNSTRLQEIIEGEHICNALTLWRGSLITTLRCHESTASQSADALCSSLLNE